MKIQQGPAGLQKGLAQAVAGLESHLLHLMILKIEACPLGQQQVLALKLGVAMVPVLELALVGEPQRALVV